MHVREFQRPFEAREARRACSHAQTPQKPRSNRKTGCNFRILREQQQRTQSLLTVMGPLEQDVAVQEAPMPFSSGQAGPGVSRAPLGPASQLVFSDVRALLAPKTGRAGGPG